VTKVVEFCPSRASGSNDHFYIAHRRDAEPAEAFYKEILSLRSLRLCGEHQLLGNGLGKDGLCVNEVERNRRIF
jgi:hypothetical protein